MAIPDYKTYDAQAVHGGLHSVSTDEKVFTYRYENADGQRFFVYATDMSGLAKSCKYNYARQRELFDSIEWIAGRKMPVALLKQPNAYVLTKRNGKELFVAILNHFADAMYDQPVVLDKAYKRMRCLHGNVAFENGRVTIQELPAFSFVAFALHE